MIVSWNTAPSGLALLKGDVHIWRSNLDLPTVEIDMLGRLLSRQERTRAERFRFEKDRRRFVAAHGILRSILGLYLGVEAGEVHFCYGKFGKLSLSDEFAVATIFFNLSHSQGIALYGLTRGRQIGVDIEKIHRFPEMGEIARQFFSATENKTLNRFSENKKIDAFFNYWTRKEAFVKAIGDGLSYSLDMFNISVDPGEPAELLRIRGDSKKASGWSIQDLNPCPGFAAARKVEIADVVCSQDSKGDVMQSLLWNFEKYSLSAGANLIGINLIGARGLTQLLRSMGYWCNKKQKQPLFIYTKKDGGLLDLFKDLDHSYWLWGDMQ